MAGEKKGCKKHRRTSPKGVLRHRKNRGKGNRRGSDPYKKMGRGERLLAKALDSIPNGRILDKRAQNGEFYDLNTRLFLRRKEDRPKKVKSTPQHETGLLMSEMNGDPE